jgi:DNA repair protein SbcD/Mre11
MSLKILCAADIHLGRGTSHLPEGVEARHCSPTAAWERLVKRALETRPDAVLLAGDLVDEQNKFYEAYGPLDSGVRRMVDGGIPVIGVAGNHDCHVLPRLADNIKGFTLLGHNQKWEQRNIEKDGKTLFQVRGFSFAQRHIKKNMLAEHRFSTSGDEPVIGLIHCDLDASGSDYAPISTAELAGTDAAAWICGHTHVPGLRRESTPAILYCGSPQGLDPSETGLHGAWEITITDARQIESRRIPLAGMRWELVDISIDDVEDREGFDQVLTRGFHDLHERIGAELGPATAVGCRMRLRSRSPIHREIRRWIETEDLTSLGALVDGVQYFTDKVIDEAGPKIDLREEAKGTSPPAILSKKILTLQEKSPAKEYERLMALGRKNMARVVNQAHFLSIKSGETPDDETVRDFLIRAGIRALESLKEQKEVEA